MTALTMPVRRPMRPEIDWQRVTLLTATGVILGLAAVNLWVILGTVARYDWIPVGVDFHQYQAHAERWLVGGSFYLERQLGGPYAIEGGDSLYPPTLLYLLVPFLVLPEILWWIVPLSIIGYVVWRLRPAPWTWPILAVIVWFWRTPELVIYGNPTMWVGAAVAAGCLWRWPAVLVALKPSLLPFALIGVRRRSWWVTAITLGLVSLPFGAMWFDFLHVVFDSNGSLAYSIRDVPFLALPLVAWAGRQSRSRTRTTRISAVETPNN